MNTVGGFNKVAVVLGGRYDKAPRRGSTTEFITTILCGFLNGHLW